MNKRHAAIMLAVSAVVSLAFASLYATSSTQSIPNATSSTQSIPNATSSTQFIPNATIPQAIAESNNQLSVDLYHEFANNPILKDKNIFFSPASIYMAFSMLYEGAKNNTAHQMEQVFGFDPDTATRHNATLYTISSINRDDPQATLKMANALWPAIWFETSDKYKDVIHSTYAADVVPLDYVGKKAESIGRINDWAYEKTNGLIPKVLAPDDPDINSLTALILTNAIYFKGTWVTQFPEEDTSPSEFWKNEADNVSADFMHVTGVFNFTQDANVQVLKMPYKGDRLSMLVVLPVDRDGIADLESAITADMMANWNKNLSSLEVIVSMPKFTMKTHYDLIKPLEDLGAKDVFSNGLSNLTGLRDPDSMDKRNLFVSKAIHDAFVDVNEEGTEAAAVTTIVTTGDSLPMRLYFTADHPFIFIIQDDESGMILFMGKLSGPTS